MLFNVGLSEWSKEADCKSVISRTGSNPVSHTNLMGNEQVGTRGRLLTDEYRVRLPDSPPNKGGSNATA